MVTQYAGYLHSKRQYSGKSGFKPTFLPSCMFDFQGALTEFNLETGRSATFADCGMGKTLMELVWAENVVRHTNKPVLVLTPLAVSAQTVEEAGKFGLEAKRSKDGTIPAKVTVTNYESLTKFDPNKFAGLVCDESSILKSFDGVTKQNVTEFMRKLPYRLLCSATPSPNDFIELGTSSEALGYLGHMDMLNRFFVNDLNNSAQGRVHGKVIEWRFKGHAEEAFWRYVVSWARAVRKPSDLGFDDRQFVLPRLIEREHIVQAQQLADGFLFPMVAVGMRDQREENRRTIQERCEMAAALVDGFDQSLMWCQLNDEGDLMEEMVKDAVQVSGADSDYAKEERFTAFASGQIKRLVTKHKIGAWGLNFQSCNHITQFPSHSYEQIYQGVRRCWRFGQKRDVTVDTITTEGGAGVLANQKRKQAQAEQMFTQLVAHMNNALGITKKEFDKKEQVPSWL